MVTDSLVELYNLVQLYQCEELTMVAPLVAYNKTIISSSTRNHKISGFRQTKPYNIDSPVTIERSWSTGTIAGAWNWGTPGNLGHFASQETLLLNSVYAKFVNQVGDQSSFGATLTAERKETFSMLTATTLRLASAARNVKRLRLADAARDLGLPYRERTIKVKLARGKRKSGKSRRPLIVRRRVFELPNGREVQKTLANGWLFYSYGVAPLMGDIYTGMETLQAEIPDKLIVARRRMKHSKNITVLPVKNRTTGTVKNWSVSASVKAYAYVKVTNPNLYIANQMGLTNPVQWINEAIPFSFVIDWFSNLSQVIGAMTDFQGMSVSNRWTCSNYLCYEDFQNLTYTSTKWNKSRHIYKRVSGLPSPVLRFGYERFSWQRGLNAISLLIGFLPRR
jgi:hypothetical protein